MNVLRRSPQTLLAHASRSLAQRLRRRRTWELLLVATLVAALAGTWLLRAPATVGHWDSAAGQDRYLQAYRSAFAKLPRPAETFDLRTSHGIVRVYRFAGTGHRSETPLLLLPGTRSATPVWADNLPDLLKLGDVYSIDLLGEPGMSVQERPITDAADEASWLRDVLAQLPEQSFHVVGLSIGGWTAVTLARHHREKIRSLVLIDPVNVFGDIPIGTALRSLPAAVPWLPRSFRDGFSSYTAGGAPVEAEPVADMIEAGMQHYRMKKPQPGRISEDELSQLDLPVLALVAGRSVMHDDQADEVAHRALRHGTVRLYPDASHAINGEHPGEIAADMREFIRTTG